MAECNLNRFRSRDAVVPLQLLDQKDTTSMGEQIACCTAACCIAEWLSHQRAARTWFHPRSRAALSCTQPARLRHRILGEEFLAIGKAVRLEEEAKDHRAVGRHRLMLISARAPAELARPADTLVILERALYHIGLLQRGVLVQRYDGP